MRILLINNHHYRLGGAEVVYINSIELLKQYGHEVITLSRKNFNTTTTNAKEYFIPYSSNPAKRFNSKDAVAQIEQIIINEKPEIVHIHNIVGGITFSILPVLKKYDIPVVASIHDYRLICPTCNFIDKGSNLCEKCNGGNYYYCAIKNCSPEGFFRSMMLSIESYLRDKIFPFQKYIDQFVFVSDFAKSKFLENIPLIENYADHIYNFTNNFESETKQGNYFLYLGRLTREKGVLTLLKAFAQNENIKLIIMGSGKLEDVVNRIKTDNVELIGYKTGNELYDWIRNASFVIVPSEWYENNPMSIIESYCYSKPVIASRIGGIPEIVIDETTGFLFEPGNHEQLSKLVKLCSAMKKEKYTSISERAFDFAKANFSPEEHYNKLFDVYEKVLKRKMRK